MFIPNVIYKREGGRELIIDIYSRLLNLGIIFIQGTITDETAQTFLASILHIRNDLMLKEITIYINSPGGSAYSGLAIVDIMRSSDVSYSTYCIGIAASAASIILASGNAGKRYILRRSKLMIHQPSGGVRGTSSDINIYAKEINELKNTIADIYAQAAAKRASAFVDKMKLDAKFFLKEIDRDTYLSAEQSISYGLVDHYLDFNN